MAKFFILIVNSDTSLYKTFSSLSIFISLLVHKIVQTS